MTGDVAKVKDMGETQPPSPKVTEGRQGNMNKNADIGPLGLKDDLMFKSVPSKHVIHKNKGFFTTGIKPKGEKVLVENSVLALSSLREEFEKEGMGWMGHKN